MKSYRDYCRPARPVERTQKTAGDLVLTGAGWQRVPGQTRVVQMKRKARA